jgi:hypothetical protein
MIVGIHTIHESFIPPGSLDHSNQRTGMAFASADEFVIAVEYRKVQFKWFSSHKVDAAFLEMGCNRWEIFETGGTRAEDEDEDNILEATLQDAIIQKDVEQEGDVYFAGDQVIVV